MDIKIENGDIVLNENGSPVTVSGIEQAVQQVNIALKARAESFVYDRKTGIKDSFDFSENTLEIVDFARWSPFFSIKRRMSSYDSFCSFCTSLSFVMMFFISGINSWLFIN